jgi:hypothetical protein
VKWFTLILMVLTLVGCGGSDKKEAEPVRPDAADRTVGCPYLEDPTYEIGGTRLACRISESTRIAIYRAYLLEFYALEIKGGVYNEQAGRRVARRFGVTESEMWASVQEGSIRDWPKPRPRTEWGKKERPVAIEWAEEELGGPVKCHLLSRDSAPNAGVAPYFVCSLRDPRDAVDRDTYCQFSVFSDGAPPDAADERDRRIDGWCDA